MPALMILNYDVTDRNRLDAYRQAARPVLIDDGGAEPLAISDATIDLGEAAPSGTDTVVLRFDSVEAARDAYDSGAYRAALADRLAATEPRFSVIVETLADAPVTNPRGRAKR
ncbi:MAG: DUF1330 domain-containing protein [Planctomycetota bacterium]|jgi:uncharacterized protein (DUF1330 family)